MTPTEKARAEAGELADRIKLIDTIVDGAGPTTDEVEIVVERDVLRRIRECLNASAEAFRAGELAMRDRAAEVAANEVEHARRLRERAQTEDMPQTEQLELARFEMASQIETIVRSLKAQGGERGEG